MSNTAPIGAEQVPSTLKKREVVQNLFRGSAIGYNAEPSKIVLANKNSMDIRGGIGSSFFGTEPNRVEKISNRTEPNRSDF
jgi:hypothetical protein